MLSRLITRKRIFHLQYQFSQPTSTSYHVSTNKHAVCTNRFFWLTLKELMELGTLKLSRLCKTISQKAQRKRLTWQAVTLLIRLLFFGQIFSITKTSVELKYDLDSLKIIAKEINYHWTWQKAFHSSFFVLILGTTKTI